ncbi:hypothetical protein BJX76DRAFT_271412 [Aspergillus varians]
MVYPGGPSKGCYTCRARKVKCDEARPVCNRCIKGNRICGGYRTLDDKKTVSRGSEQRLVTSKGEDDMAKRLASLALSPTSLFGQNRDQERANLCAFYSRLVRLPQVQGLHGGLLTVTTLPAILADLKQPIMTTSPLPSALSALLLTLVSEKGNDKHCSAVTKALTCYGRALKLTRRLTEESDEGRRGELIMTIFILGMYEDLNSSEDHIRTTSNSHLEGAVAFVRTQKCKSFGEDINKRIYSALLNRALYTCFDDIKINTPFMFTLNDLRLLHADIAAERNIDRLNLYSSALLIIHMQLRQIEKEVLLSFPSNGAVTITATSKANALLRSITSTEYKMAEWPNALPPQSKYLTVRLSPDDSTDLWGVDAHIYRTFSAGNDWLRYRMLQILAHSLRLRAYHLIANPLYGYCHSAFEHEDAKAPGLAGYFAMTHSKIRAIASDICASMPYHLGYRSKSKPGLRYPSEPFHKGRYPRLLSACQIIWPLYVAGIAEGVDVAQRLWISRQLAFINEEMGIGKAAVLARLVKKAAGMKTQSIA